MKLSHPFTYKNIVAVLPYEVCLRRQSAILKESSKCQHPQFPTCHYCEEGKKIRAKFPDWKYIKDDKRRKPDRINLRKDKKSGSRAACLKAIDLKPETKGADEAEESPWLRTSHHAPIKPFNAKLFLQAQKEYIESIRKQVKTVAVEKKV